MTDTERKQLQKELEQATSEAARAIYYERYAEQMFRHALTELARKLGVSDESQIIRQADAVLDTGPDGLLARLRQLAKEREERAAVLRRAAEACQSCTSAADIATAAYRCQ